MLKTPADDTFAETIADGKAVVVAVVVNTAAVKPQKAAAGRKKGRS